MAIRSPYRTRRMSDVPGGTCPLERGLVSSFPYLYRAETRKLPSISTPCLILRAAQFPAGFRLSEPRFPGPGTLPARRWLASPSGPFVGPFITTHGAMKTSTTTPNHQTTNRNSSRHQKRRDTGPRIRPLGNLLNDDTIKPRHPQATAYAFLWDVQLHRPDRREGH